MRWGARLNDATAVDVLVAALTDPFDEVHMGNTAENVARKWGISREDQDELAVESHRRALDAIEKGRFKGQIIPVELKSRAGSTFFTTDESPRSDATIENLARLKPAFDNEAFAAQVLAVRRDLDLPPEKTNPNGSGISLGHPLGATGAIVTVKALHELQRIGGKYALVTMCIGGGQGIAAIFEAIN
jgi:acetyl-CoA C-acetyltransferase